MIGLLIFLLVAAFILAAIWYVLGLFPIPDKFRDAFVIVLAVVVLVYGLHRYGLF